jgi:DNA segregation ATPase FtsK/SpoIIIE, S-DNA-T family
MGRAKSRSAAASKKKKKGELNIEIVGIIAISLGILSLVSMYSDSTGVVGNLIRSKSMTLAGFGGYIFPCIILVIGFFSIINRIDYIRKSVSLVISYLGFLTILDIYLFPFIDGISFTEKLNLAVIAGESGDGGGIIGAFFSYLFLNLFGTTGSYIVIFSIILVSILVFTNASILKILNFIFIELKKIIQSSLIVIRDFVYIDDTNKKPNRKSKKETTQSKTELSNAPSTFESADIVSTNEVDQKIRILDYTKNSDKESVKKTEEHSQINNSDDQLEIHELNSSTVQSYEYFTLPGLELLAEGKTNNSISDKKEVLSNASKLIETLSNFGIEAKIIQASIGPSITRYELQPAPGVKVSKIVSLTNDIALSLASSDLRMEAPIPGKSAIGIEVPNKHKVSVSLKEILQSQEYSSTDTKIPLALGKDIAGKPIVANIEKMPHLLIAGATGSGKSVCINTLITSILYKSKPDEVKLLMIDPKVVELSVYNGIPHLLIPVVTDAKKAASALNWAVQEMTRRYNLFAQNAVRDIVSYNNKVINTDLEKLPQLVIIIDELADLMMVSASEVEDYICRLAQMARAAGMHLIVATQRPSVDIITGTIKANIPSRISFAVSSQADSRTILDMGGAEKLLGKGDMLYYPVGESKPMRIQGAYIGEDEVEKIVDFLKNQSDVEYKKDIINEINSDVDLNSNSDDELLPKAIEIVVTEGQASISLLQRKLRIGYARAARIIDEMEERGVIGGYEGSKPRKVLISKEDMDA